MTEAGSSGKAVLFDLDGTLLDTIPLIVESFQHTFCHFFGSPYDEIKILAAIGTPLDTFFRQFWPGQADEMKKIYLDYNHARLDTHIAVFHQMPVLLEMLSAMQIPLGVVTSKSRFAAMRNLRDFDLERYFRIVIAKESTMKHKPDPEPLLEAMRQLGLCKPDRVIYVGDSMHDLNSAKRAGCRSAIVDWTVMPAEELLAAKPDLWLKNPGQLLEYLSCL